MSSLEANKLAEQIRDFLSNNGFNLQVLGQILQILHVLGVVLFFYLMFSTNTTTLFTLLMIAIFVLATQIYFRGCFISLLEKKLTGQKYTLLDKIFDFQINFLNTIFGLNLLKDKYTHIKMTWASALLSIVFILYGLFIGGWG